MKARWTARQRAAAATWSGRCPSFGDGLLEEVKPTLPDIPEYNLRTMLSLEKNVTGLYISGHPLGDYSKALSALDMNTARLTELLESPDHGLSFDGQRVRMAACSPKCGRRPPRRAT